MAQLDFKLAFSSREMAEAALPVEVRRVGEPFLERTVTTKTLDVTPGQYVVSARLPAGQEISTVVDVTANGASARLLVPPDQRSPHEWAELAHFTHGARRSKTRVADWSELPAVSAHAQPLLRIFRGNALTGECSEVDANNWLARDPASQLPMLRFDVKLPECAVVQLSQAGRPPRNVVVVSTPDRPMIVILTAFADQTYRIEAHFGRPEIDLQARYARQLDFANASLIAEHTAELARQLLYDKMADPVAAAAGACALLRIGKLESLEQAWTENLANWFPWLPDGAAIRGEHLARLGAHTEAARSFVQVVSRGLPVFATAFFFAVERLRLYSLVKPDGVHDSEIEDAYQALARFAHDVDPVQPITTFPGANPNKPSRAAEAFQPRSPLAAMVK